MPKGGARPGAGRPRKPIAHHLLTGGYRPDRHGPLPGNVVPMPEPTPGWQPAKAERAALGVLATDWLDTTLKLYQLDALEGCRLMAALRSLTRVEQLEAAIAKAGVTSDGGPNPHLPALAREQRVFLSQWASLNLGK